MCACAAVVVLATNLLAQPVFRGTEIFPAEEFAARRARVIAQIGDGVAIVLGTTEPPGEMPFRQNNQFFYLTGVTEPRASVIIDGRARTTTVFLQPKTATQDNSQYGPGMGPGAAAATALGVDAAVDRARVHGRHHRAGQGQADDLHAVCRRGARQPEPGRSDASLGHQPQGSVGRSRFARDDVRLQARGRGARLENRESRSDRQRAARGQERAGDRGDPRRDTDHRRGDPRGDEGAQAGDARVRAAGRAPSTCSRRTARSAPRILR